VQAELTRAARTKIEFAPDQVALAEVRVTLRDVLRILTKVYQEHYHGDEFEVADFREMVLLSGQDELTATGLATPPSESILREQYEPMELDVPPWAATTLTATGSYQPGEGESADRAAQADAARLDGIARLNAQIEKLVIQKGVTVAEFLGYHQDLKDDVALFLSGTHVVAAPTTTATDALEVKVELPLRRLWEIARRDMKLEEVEPPATGPRTPATAPAGATER
jgi:hypothetical protein